MKNIPELERAVLKNQKKASAGDLDYLARHYWALAKESGDFRERRMLLKRASHFAGLAFGAGADDVEQLELYRSIFQRSAEVHAWPADERGKLSRVIGKWAEKTGADNHKIVASSKGKLAIEGGTFAVGDPALPGAWIEGLGSYDSAFIGWTNRGERLCVATGGDGLYKAELRLIDAAEPILTTKEYKKLSASSQSVVIEVRSGFVGIADFADFLVEPWLDKQIAGTVRLKVPPGRYRVCAHGFSTARSESIVIVLTSTSDAAANDIKSVDSLFG
jgi:hypothetical protein